MFPFSIYTLGCKLNQLEGEAIAEAFIREGFFLQPWGVLDKPGILIVNTCTVTSKADQKARRVIRQALRDNPESCVIVTGCYAKLDSDEIINMANEKNRLFVSGKENEKSKLLFLPHFIKNVQPGKTLSEILSLWISDCGNNNSAFCYKPAGFSFHSRAYLKIQDGCNNHCTYCRVRLARGSAVSITPEEALSRLIALENSGCAEVMLTGVNITQYRSKGMDLPDLLEYLLVNTNAIALRLASLEPEGITEKFASIAAHKRIQPHFHISVQSGSDMILEKMGRVYTSQAVAQCAAMLRNAKENPFLACDIITGFPGETEIEFERTIELCKQIKFAWIHAFPFSKRPGTAAFSFKDSVCERDVSKRVEFLTEMAVENKQTYARYWIGKKLSAIVEKGKTGKEKQCRAVSENYLKLLVNYSDEKPKPGTAIKVILVSICDGTVTADLV